jgi:hypothetical protein
MIRPDAFESRFLHAAGNALACTWEVMGNRVTGLKWHSLEFSLLGLQDWCCEMRMICREEKQRRLSL